MPAGSVSASEVVAWGWDRAGGEDDPGPCPDFILGGSCRTVSIREESRPPAVDV